MNGSNMWDRFMLGAYGILICSGAMAAYAHAGDLDTNYDEWRLNEVQYIGTHNSYHIAPGEGMGILMNAVDFDPSAEWTSERLNVALDYTHPSLTTQLKLGMRQFELDVYADPEGGRFSNPGALRLKQNMSWKLPIIFNPEGDLSNPGFKVLHKPEYDFMSTCYLLIKALREIHTWSEANPDHYPLIIHIEVKDGAGEALTEDYEPAKVDTFDKATWLRLEEEIKSVFPVDKIVTPDGVRGDYSAFRKAISAGGWPKLKDLKGKVIYLLLNKKDTTHNFMTTFDDSLEGRLFFTSLQPNHPWASWYRVPDPNDKDIPDLLKQGFLVTTQAGTHTVHARVNDTQRRDKALGVGAHFILTDFPIPDRRFSDYQVVFQDGSYVRKNPATTK
ncbi:Ca2+-dependent phosphoinositide-specific phospholipase C [Planctomycetota bacterium]